MLDDLAILESEDVHHGRAAVGGIVRLSPRMAMHDDVVAIREPIVIDGVATKPGDYLLGDCDGVVVIPQEVAASVVAEAEAKVSGENTVREELAAGVPVAEVFRKHGIL